MQTKTTIAFLAEPVIQVSPDTIVEEVKNHFSDKPPTASVVVVRDNKPIGLMTNYNLNRQLGTRYGVSLFYQREVERIMDPNPLVVSSNDRLEDVAEIAMNRKSNSLYDDIIVTENEGVAGKVSIQNILEAMVKVHVKAKENAEASARAKSDFLANMSHEIRTPINAITGLTELAQKTELSPKQQDYLKKISFSTQSLLGIINDILDLSKIEAGKLDLESSDFVLSDIMDNLADMFISKMTEKGIEMVLAIDDNVPKILNGDPFRLGQVLINLISNALKFTHEGEIIIKASVIKSWPGSVGLLFKVKDTGIGIAKDKADALFTPFTQADSSTTRRYGGTGLGLTICKRLVEAMNGQIAVKSLPSVGSLFYFTATFDLPDKPAVEKLQTPAELSGIKTLVVDDNDEARHILTQVLKSFSFNVEAAASGQEALDCLKDRVSDFDLVIMDWKMPEMDGITTLRSMQNMPIASDLPVIFMTAFGRDEIMEEAQSAGARAFLTKPVKQSVLFETILDIFGKTVAVSGKREVQEAEVLVQLAGCRVLVVDDNPINQQVAQELLNSMDVEVDTANNGKEALTMMNSRSFDAVLMDVQMPEMDGFEATRRIRQLEMAYQQPKLKTHAADRETSFGGDRIPVIAMTAAAMKEDRDKCLKAGMDDYISKPVDTKKLYQVLGQWIRRDGQKSISEATIKKSGTENATPTLPEQLPGIDVKSCLDRFLGNQTMLKNLLTDFAKKHSQAAAEISRLISDGNQNQAAAAAHNLKGVASIFSAESLRLAALNLETEIKQGGNGTVEPLLTALKNELSQVLDSAQQIIDAV